MGKIPDLAAIRDWCLTKFQPRGNYAAMGDIKANTKDDSGYVPAGAGQANKVWKTDENGNPAWRDEEGGGTDYTLPTASTEVLGGVKVDGTTITIDENGVLHAVAVTEYANNLLGGES